MKTALQIETKENASVSLHHFKHDAMATVFEIFISHPVFTYAGQSAQAAFEELDRLEGDFSRFIENSDISKINASPANKPVEISLDTFECIRIAVEMNKKTFGAFDITVGHLADFLTKNNVTDKPDNPLVGMDLLELAEDGFAVTKLADDLRIDLGGIGKGYAVDQMTEVLKDWGIETALIHGGFSSVLALGSPKGTKGWPVTLYNPVDNKKLHEFYLKDESIGSSGLDKGYHIIDPCTLKPVNKEKTIWVTAGTAATADALSTAFMVMDQGQIETFRTICSCQAFVGLLKNGLNSNDCSFKIEYVTGIIE